MSKKPYSKKNSKGDVYYLHGNGRLFYFSKKIGKNALEKLPEGFTVKENKKTGLLYVTKK